jgi:hypothetical protein
MSEQKYRGPFAIKLMDGGGRKIQDAMDLAYAAREMASTAASTP